jgi:predicted metal-dependent phosphoesterase TrpH
MYRGLIHFHSEYSYDSILSIKSIVNFALKENLNFLVLTDHDSIKGAIELSKYINKHNYNIEVIISAEYNTEYGDIIALNINKEIENMNFNSFINEVKKQNGLLFFPHPYKGHANIEHIAEKVDFIEIFNSRTDNMSNEKALNLASKYNKLIYYATDAHNYSSLKNCILEFKKDGTLIESLKNNTIMKCNQRKSYYIEVLYSQFIKSFKKKDLYLFKQLIRSLLVNIIKLNINKKI